MKHNCKSLVGTLAVGLLALAPAFAQSGSANRLAGADHTFVTKAAEGGLAEVQLGNLAKDKATNPDVKTFGQQMVDDHSKANDELKTLASSKGITLPAEPDAKQKAEHDRLSKLSGAEFDREYMRLMVSDHRTDVAEFRRESEHGTDADVKAFAAKTLPTLEHHLQMAESTEAKVK
jgi:putative membrane protein